MGNSEIGHHQNTPQFSKTRKIKHYKQVLLGKEQKVHMSGQVFINWAKSYAFPMESLSCYLGIAKMNVFFHSKAFMINSF